MKAFPGRFARLGVMLLSLSGVQVATCSGYDCVSHSAIPNQKAGCSCALVVPAGGAEDGSRGSMSE